MNVHLLDTSALLAHFFGESGWETVESLLENRECRVDVCVVTMFEFNCVLRAKGVSPADIQDVSGAYSGMFSSALPVDVPAIQHAIRLRERLATRIPLADALVAGCALSRGAVLVHRDTHMTMIPEDLLKQVCLA